MKINARQLISIVIFSAAVLLFGGQSPTYALPFTTVYISRPGVAYHRHNCRVLRNGGRHITAISLSNAKEYGFRPCTRCNPPTW